MSYINEKIVKSVDVSNSTYTTNQGTVLPTEPNNAYLVLNTTSSTHVRYVSDESNIVTKQEPYNYSLKWDKPTGLGGFQVPYWNPYTNDLSGSSIYDYNGQVGINGSGHDKSVFSVNSYTQGSKPFPIVDQWYRDYYITPGLNYNHRGLMVYNDNTQKLQHWNGSTWSDVGGSTQTVPTLYTDNGIISTPRVVTQLNSLEFKTQGNPFNISGLPYYDGSTPIANLKPLYYNTTTNQIVQGGNITPVINTYEVRLTKTLPQYQHTIVSQTTYYSPGQRVSTYTTLLLGINADVPILEDTSTITYEKIGTSLNIYFSIELSGYPTNNTPIDIVGWNLPIPYIKNSNPPPNQRGKLMRSGASWDFLHNTGWSRSELLTDAEVVMTGRGLIFKIYSEDYLKLTIGTRYGMMFTAGILN